MLPGYSRAPALDPCRHALVFPENWGGGGGGQKGDLGGGPVNNNVVFLKSIYQHHTTGSDVPVNHRLVHFTA